MVCGGPDEHLCVCACVSPFLIMCCQSELWDRPFRKTLPKSHNTDPLGGRISHQPAAESPPAQLREAEITEDAIRGQGGIKLGLLN